MRMRGGCAGRMSDGSGLSAAAGVCAGDGDGSIQFAVSVSGDTEKPDVDEHGDDEGVAMKLFSAGACVRSRLAARRGARQRGATIVEQALILPILLAIMFGIIDMSRALYSYSYVSYIARDATRWASVRSTNLNGPPAPISAADVTNYVKNVSGMGLDAARITADTNFVAPANSTPLCPGGTGNSIQNRKPGCVVQVTVNYNFKFIFPFLPAGTLPMSSESQMIITQ